MDRTERNTTCHRYNISLDKFTTAKSSGKVDELIGLQRYYIARHTHTHPHSNIHFSLFRFKWVDDTVLLLEFWPFLLRCTLDSDYKPCSAWQRYKWTEKLYLTGNDCHHTNWLLLLLFYTKCLYVCDAHYFGMPEIFQNRPYIYSNPIMLKCLLNTRSIYGWIEACSGAPM